MFIFDFVVFGIVCFFVYYIQVYCGGIINDLIDVQCVVVESGVVNIGGGVNVGIIVWLFVDYID